MTMFKVHSATRATDVQLDEPGLLHPNDVSEGGDDRGGEHAEPRKDLQDLNDMFAGGMSALLQIQSLYNKAGLDVRTTVLEA